MATLNRRRVAVIAVFAALLGGGALALAARGEDAYRQPQQMVRLPDGHRLNLICMGEGTPTVVLDSGLAMPASNWMRVQPELAKTTRVCAYERAGINFSDRGSMPRPRTSGLARSLR